MRRTILLTLIGVSLQLATSGVANAQYKNTSFGIDGGFWLILKGPLHDSATGLAGVDPDPTRRAFRFGPGGRFGGEANLKLTHDRVWFTGRVNLGVFGWAPPDTALPNDEIGNFEIQANQALGTLLSVEGLVGLRIFLATDRVRPYFQLSLSYMRILALAGAAEATCTAPGPYCNGSMTNVQAYLANTNLGGVHGGLGIEFIIMRDVAIHFFFDYAHYINFIGPDIDAMTFNGGVSFYN